MTEFTVLLDDNTSFTVEDLSPYHIENLKECSIVKNVTSLTPMIIAK